MDRELKLQRLYRHFKGRLYYVLLEAIDSETGQNMVVYQAMYGDYKTYVRPKEMFLSKVDTAKYPEVTATYRFTLVEE